MISLIALTQIIFFEAISAVHKKYVSHVARKMIFRYEWEKIFLLLIVIPFVLIMLFTATKQLFSLSLIKNDIKLCSSSFFIYGGFCCNKFMKNEFLLGFS